jgi:type I restriction enzyme S subunit
VIHDLKPYPVYKDSGVPWLGKVPEHWAVLPHRALFNEVKERDHPNEQMLSVTITQGVIKQRALLEGSSKKDSSNQDKSAYKLVCPGDIAYNKMRAWQGAVGVSDFRGIVSPAYVVVRLRDENSPRYFHYLFRTPGFAKEAERWSYGITSDMWSLRPEHFKMIYACLPPLPEQAAIFRFLDHADGRIRRYIRAKQKLITLLEEQKQAIIHRAVTRGLDPNVRLKPSGVEWLGDVPEHWEVRKLGQIAVSFRTGPFGSILHQSDYVEGGTPVINPTHMSRGRIVEDTRCSVSPKVSDRLINYRLELHNLIFSRRGELGRCALVRDREAGWLCGTGSIRVHVAYDNIEPEYLIQSLQVRWIGEYLSLSSVGATMDSLNTGILKGVPVLVPPINEQRALLAWIAEEGRRIDSASAGAEREISLLREHRTRLIADVVTGKLDVREAAERLPEEAEEPESLDDTESLAEGDEDVEGVDLNAAPEVAEA